MILNHQIRTALFANVGFVPSMHLRSSATVGAFRVVHSDTKVTSTEQCTIVDGEYLKDFQPCILKHADISTALQTYRVEKNYFTVLGSNNGYNFMWSGYGSLSEQQTDQVKAYREGLVDVNVNFQRVRGLGYRSLKEAQSKLQKVFFLSTK